MKKLYTLLVAAIALLSACELMPRNNMNDCQEQCKDTKKPNACLVFCDCIHNQGQPLDSCLDKYNKAPEEKPMAKPPAKSFKP